VFAQKALALDDSSTLALALVSDNDRMSGRFDEAVRDARRVVATDPNYSWGYSFLAQALDADGKPGDAVPAIQKAIRGGGSSPEKSYSKDLGEGVIRVISRPQTANRSFFGYLLREIIACNLHRKTVRGAVFHATNRRSNAGDHIAYNAAFLANWNRGPDADFIGRIAKADPSANPIISHRCCCYPH
jgi:tetratricopeptide (TPR) repeat protein